MDHNLFRYQHSFSPQRAKRDHVSKYLTPKNKTPLPLCNNKTSLNEENDECYLNPLKMPFDECIYKNNFWQETKNNICFPKVSDEETTMDDILYALPDNPTDEAIRRESLKEVATGGIIPNIEYQLQDNRFNVPKIPETSDGHNFRPMTAKDFDELDYTFGEEMSSPLPPGFFDMLPEGVDPRYTYLDENRIVGKNPIPIIAALNQANYEQRSPFTYQSIIDLAIGPDSTLSEKNKKMWKDWFLMTDASTEEKEKARDLPLPYRTEVRPLWYGKSPDPPYLQWGGQEGPEIGLAINSHLEGVLPVRMDRYNIELKPEWTDKETMLGGRIPKDQIPSVFCPICRIKIQRKTHCNHMTHTGYSGCFGKFLYEEELIRLRQRLLKHLLEGEAQRKSTKQSLADPLRFEWDYPKDWDDMKQRHEAERAQEYDYNRAKKENEKRFTRPTGNLPRPGGFGFVGEEKWEPVEELLHQHESWDDEAKNLYRDELNKRRTEFINETRVREKVLRDTHKKVEEEYKEHLEEQEQERRRHSFFVSPVFRRRRRPRGPINERQLRIWRAEDQNDEARRQRRINEPDVEVQPRQRGRRRISSVKTSFSFPQKKPS